MEGEVFCNCVWRRPPSAGCVRACAVFGLATAEGKKGRAGDANAVFGRAVAVALRRDRKSVV